MTRPIFLIAIVCSLIAAACSLGPSGTGISPSAAPEQAVPAAAAAPKAGPAAKPALVPALIVKPLPHLWVLSNELPYKPEGGMSFAFEHVGTYAHMTVTAIPSERIRSAKMEAGTIHAAYETSGMKVGPLQSDLNGAYGRFAYSGTRDGIPIKGALMVYRLRDNPAYTIKLQGEWLPNVDEFLIEQFDEFVSNICVE